MVGQAEAGATGTLHRTDSCSRLSLLWNTSSSVLPAVQRSQWS